MSKVLYQIDVNNINVFVKIIVIFIQIEPENLLTAPPIWIIIQKIRKSFNFGNNLFAPQFWSNGVPLVTQSSSTPKFFSSKFPKRLSCYFPIVENFISIRQEDWIAIYFEANVVKDADGFPWIALSVDVIYLHSCKQTNIEITEQ